MANSIVAIPSKIKPEGTFNTLLSPFNVPVDIIYIRRYTKLLKCMHCTSYMYAYRYVYPCNCVYNYICS